MDQYFLPFELTVVGMELLALLQVLMILSTQVPPLDGMHLVTKLSTLLSRKVARMGEGMLMVKWSMFLEWSILLVMCNPGHLVLWTQQQCGEECGWAGFS